jgi:hypothetical protein
MHCNQPSGFCSPSGFKEFPMRTRTSFSNPITQFENRSLVLFAVLTLGSASALWAQSAAAPMNKDKIIVALFAQADMNGDRALSQEEAKAIPALAERFSDVDTNGDGLVTQTEFLASMAPAKS